MPQTVQAAEKPGCIICEYAVTELVDYLDNNKTEVAIEKALVRLCLKLPKSVKVTNNAAVDHSLSFEHLSDHKITDHQYSHYSVMILLGCVT